MRFCHKPMVLAHRLFAPPTRVTSRCPWPRPAHLLRPPAPRTHALGWLSCLGLTSTGRPPAPALHSDRAILFGHSGSWGLGEP